MTNHMVHSHSFRLPALFLCFVLPLVAQQRPLDRDFLDAVQNKDVPRILSLLKQGANVNAKEPINGYFALEYAINWPDLNLVKLLLDKGADVNAMNGLGSTALMSAVRQGGREYTAIAKLLIERGADVRAGNDTTIFSAVKYADPEVVRLLLDKGAPPNAKDPRDEGDTVLMSAAGGESAKTIELLLVAGANPKDTNNEGETALMKAVSLDHRYTPATRLPMIELLLQKGSDINARDRRGRTPLLHSVTQYMSEAGGVISHPEVVQLLLGRGADPLAADEGGDTALIKTVGVYQGPIEIVRQLLSSGVAADAQNKKGTSALMVAADNGKLDVAQLLLEKGVNLNLKDAAGATALDHAIAAGHSELAKLLLSKGATSSRGYKSEAEILSASRNFALLRATTYRNLKEVETLLAQGADVNSRNNRGDTALLLAVEYNYGEVEILKLLLAKGGDINAVNEDGETALMVAARRNNRELAKILLEQAAAQKVDLKLRNKEGQTALHIAAANLNAEIVKGLVASGAEVDARDPGGKTALHLAVANEGSVPNDVIQHLLDKGARLEAKDTQGNTALMLAAKAASMSGVEFLLSKGAQANVENNEGMTALKFARALHENKRLYRAELVESRIITMLLNAGAKE